MFNKLVEYVKDSKTKVLLLKNKINIVNYKKIIIFENDRIIVDCNEFQLEIIGNSLVINRLFNDEILIDGDINTINIRGIND